MPAHRQHIKRMSEQDIGKSSDACLEIKTLPITVRDDVQDLNAIIALIHRFAGSGKAELVIIDHAQLVRTKAHSSGKN